MTIRKFRGTAEFEFELDDTSIVELDVIKDEFQESLASCQHYIESGWDFLAAPKLGITFTKDAGVELVEISDSHGN